MTENKDTKFKPIVIKNLFLKKNPSLAKKIPGFIYSYLNKVTHIDEVNYFFSTYDHLKGVDFAKQVLEYLNIKVKIKNPENILTDGRFVFASNHPLGGADGIILIALLGEKFDLAFPVNDILLNVKNLNNIFTPINKHGAQAKDAAESLNNAFNSDKQIIIFPAGLVSRRKKGKIEDLEWKKTFITKAKSSNRDIIPVHVSGRNSNFFYNLANIRKLLGIKANIEMLYLIAEFSKHRNKTFEITFGEKISIESIDKSKSHKKWAQTIKNIVHSLNI